MAKDFSQSRIPRLDGGPRITTQVITNTKCNSLRSTQYLKRTNPSQFAMKKSISGDRMNENPNHLIKKTKSNILQKFLNKSEQMEIDNTTIICQNNKDTIKTIEKHKKDDTNLKLIEPNSLTTSLTRSDTFISDNNILKTTNNLINVTCTLNNPINNKSNTNNLYNTTRILDGGTTKQNILTDPDDTFDNMKINDYVQNCLDLTLTAQNNDNSTLKNYANNDIEDTYILDKNNMKKIFNSTMNNERLLDVSTTAILPSTDQYFNITQDLENSIIAQNENDNILCKTNDQIDSTILPPQKLHPEHFSDNMKIFDKDNDVINSIQLQDPLLKLNTKSRFSLGLDLTDCTLDCSIELCDVSLASTTGPVQMISPSLLLKKQNSFEMDESLGILTPDQMKEFLDSTTTTNLDLPLLLPDNHNSSGVIGKLTLHQMRIDQTPSPEDLPLDTIDVKTDIIDNNILPQELNHQNFHQGIITYQELSQTDTESKTDQLTKSTVSKVSNSFITSITSITSLDTGYQGDGEMSRPASRGAGGDHSPSNGPRKQQLERIPSFNNNIPNRRQDPMTDSDFFTESDADDIFNRGDRRAQVIDGQLYGPTLQPSSVFITEQQQQQMDDSCMESSGIFTDVENRCEDDILQNRLDNNADIDMSPDGSTDTIKSNNTEYRRNEQNHNNKHNINSSTLNQQGQHNNIAASETTSSSSSLEIQNVSSNNNTSERIITLNYNSSSSSNNSNSSTANGEDSSLSLQTREQQQQHNNNQHNSITNCGTINSAVENNSVSINDVMNSTVEKATINLLTSNNNNSNTIIGIPNTNDDKKNTNAQKLLLKQNHTIIQSTALLSVKKLNSPRKQHFLHGGANKYEEKKLTNDITTKSSSITNCGIKLLKTKSLINPFLKKSISNFECGNKIGNIGNNNNVDDINSDDIMLIKHNSLRNDNNTSPENHNNLNLNNKYNLKNNDCNIVCGSGTTILQHQQQQQPRKFPPNKWDAVMNKIAENKINQKINYNDVKSKVSTGNGGGGGGGGSTASLTRRISGLNKTPIKSSSAHENNAGTSGNNGFSTPKHILHGTTNKRGRSFSKDSSQSDLSLSGGSPKPRSAVNNIRSAKKRDVRTLSISPTDLGPPPKTQTNGTIRTKPKVISPQKRILQNAQQQQTTITSSGGPIKDKISPCNKKVLSRSRPQTQIKVPHNDNNRLLSHTTSKQQQQQQQNLHPKCDTKNEETNSNKTNCIPLNKEHIDSSRQSATSPNGNFIRNNNNLQQRKENEIEKYRRQQEITNEVLRSNLAYANKGIEALGILIQYLACDLDAFSYPNLKDKYLQIKTQLTENKKLLEESTVLCQNLRDEITENESQYLAREAELQAIHKCELKKVETSFNEFKISAKERIINLESELEYKKSEYDKKLQDYSIKTEKDLKKFEEDLHLAELKNHELLKLIDELNLKENELKERATYSEETLENCLRTNTERERELSDKINILTKELDSLRNQTENRERELEEKLNLSHDEISVLRNKRNSFDTSLSNGTKSNGIDPNNGSSSPNKIQRLQDEVESLRCVLELKQSEISDLRKHTQELQRSVDNVPAMQMKISAFETRVEDLQIQLKAKIEEEKELIQRNKHLQESYTHEVKNRNRLSLHNEELQWKLKQNSEKFALTLNELSKSYQEQASFLNTSKISTNSQDSMELFSSHNSSLVSLNRSNGTDRTIGCFQMDDISPPPSPLVKGVVEKNDSVSWVLEMDDETPEVLASRMIRRAGSFRSNINEKSPNLKRQYSRQSSVTIGIPLTQSASATSVLKTHSEDSINMKQITGNQNSRIRSKSVTIKKTDKNPVRHQNSTGIIVSSLKDTDLSDSWEKPLHCSSPYNVQRNIKSPTKQLISKPMIQSSSSAAAAAAGAASSSNQTDLLYRRNRANSFDTDTNTSLFRKQQGNLITCDALALSQRLELRSIPSHPSVQDLKKLKKTQEIQESAGEAMVSETNSEDEGCSASLDDSVSPTSSSTSSLCGKSNLSAEDCIVMDKISISFGGTPMEVSWSDDVEQYPSESVV